MAITREEIEYVKQNVPMDWVLGNMYHLQKSINGKYHCPFGSHDDSHASLSVKTDNHRNICKCFACNEGGDVISVVRKIDGLSFQDALFKLEDEYGIKTFEPERQKEQHWTYDVKTTLPLTYAELRFLNFEPFVTIYTYDETKTEQMLEEIENARQDYQEGYGRHDVPFSTIQSWIENDYLYRYGKRETYSMLSEYKENPEGVVYMINERINERYRFYCSLPISGETELIKERIEKLQNKINKLSYNKKYQEWITELNSHSDFEKEDNFEILER